MKWVLHRSDYFNQDFDLQYRWYLAEVGEAVAESYFAAVVLTLNQLALQPEIGHVRRFTNHELIGLRSVRIRRPFDVHLIFYRYTDRDLIVERIMHGVRDLPRRLVEPPEANQD